MPMNNFWRDQKKKYVLNVMRVEAMLYLNEILSKGLVIDEKMNEEWKNVKWFLKDKKNKHSECNENEGNVLFEWNALL